MKQKTGIQDNNACENTDRRIYEEVDGTSYGSILVTKGGGIGIEYSGIVTVKPLKEWSRMALAAEEAATPEDSELVEELNSWCAHITSAIHDKAGYRNPIMPKLDKTTWGNLSDMKMCAYQIKEILSRHQKRGKIVERTNDHTIV